MKRSKSLTLCLLLTALLALSGCADGNKENNNGKDEIMSEEVTKNPEVTATTAPTATPTPVDEMAALFKGIEKAKNAKGMLDNNPLMTQRFGADPYALVYDDTLYIYMTGDVPEYDANGELKDNTYGKITTINVISTKDMVNWTDHGCVYAAGKNGAAKTANNSWAPAATWKMIDGKPKFFLYFANNGSGIFVLTSDSPTGPFTDPLGTELISRNTPTCASVIWLFDPAVFVDDDGSAYIYFGGGVPQNNPAHPYTARVAKLGDDMISIDGDPVAIDPPYLFEDSGIHKMGNTYYYTYSSNFSVDKAGTEEYGLKNGEICYMTSDNPMGPFTYQGVILPNPGEFFGAGGNNHHCVFSFRGDWYITYHAQSVVDRLGYRAGSGYRSTHIDKLAINEDGTLGRTKGTRAGVEQSGYLNPYETVEAETIWNSAGVTTTQYGETSVACGSGNMVVCGIETGSWIGLKGVDFGDKGASELVASVCGGAEEGVIQIRIDRLMGDIVGYLTVPAGDGVTYNEQVGKLLETVTGVHDLYFTFYGSGYSLDTWKFR